MANSEHLAILEQGVEVWNEWRRGNYPIKPNFNEADSIVDRFSSMKKKIEEVDLSAIPFG